MRTSVSSSAATTTDLVTDRLLLVERPTDVGFFEVMLASNQRSKVRVLELGGVSNLSNKVQAQVQAPDNEGIRWLGIILDGDANPAGRFKSVCNAISSLTTVTFEIPSQPWSRSKRIVASGSASIAIFPDGTAPEDIERYLWDRILDNHPAAKCVEEMIACLHARGVDKENDWKAKCNAFLHALRPSNEKSTMTPALNGVQLYRHTPPDSHQRLLDLIPADEEEI